MTTLIVAEKNNPSISSPEENPDRYAPLPQTGAGTVGAGVVAESTQQTPVASPASPKSGGYWLVRPLRAFSRLLAGPPMSERDRFRYAVTEAAGRKYQGITNAWYTSR